MRSRAFATVTLSMALIMASGTAWACTAAGPNKHVGLLLGIDQAAKSFTLLDAQSNRPITFLAEDNLLAALQNVTRQIIVDFRDEGSKLRAIIVQN